MMQYVMPQFKKRIVSLDKLAREKRPELIEQIKGGIFELIEQTQMRQESGRKENIQCIGIHLLRTEVLRRRYQLLFCAYGERFLLDPALADLHIEFAEFFQPLEEMQTSLLESLPKANGFISADRIGVFIQQMIGPWRAYLIELSRLAVRALAKSDCFAQIQTAENFFVICGEDKDFFDEIYVTEKETRNELQIKAAIVELESGKEDLACKVFERYSFQELVFTKRNLSKSKVVESKFIACNLDESHLVKTEFINCRFEGVMFNSANIFDANFSGCSFYDCSFNNAFGGITPPPLNTENVLGFTGVSFTDCTFNDVVFDRAYLMETDFTGAEFENVSFEGADLKKSIFSDQSIASLSLSEYQMMSITLV